MIDGTRRLLRIRAEQVLGEFSYDFQFENALQSDRIRILYAPNGFGKTTLLKAVKALLTPTADSLQSLIDIPLQSLTISFSGDGEIALKRINTFSGSYEVFVKTNSRQKPKSLKVEPSEFSGRFFHRYLSERNDFQNYIENLNLLSFGATFVGDDRLATPTEEDNESRLSLRAQVQRRKQGPVKAALDSVEKLLNQSALASFSIESRRDGVYEQITRNTLEGEDLLSASDSLQQLLLQLDEILKLGSPLETYGLLSMNSITGIKNQVISTEKTNSQLPSLYKILKPYFDSLRNQISSLAEPQALIDTFVTAVNHFLTRKTLSFSAGSGIKLQKINGENLDPDSLSSGERHLLYLLSQAVLATGNNHLVIIDEPELSLGIEWQRDLLMELLRCSSSGNVQFLVASHSLQVMSGVDASLIIQPSISDNG